MLPTISVKPIADELHSLPTTITGVSTAPLLAGAVATPLLGRLGDLRGHRRLYLTGMTMAVLFSILTAVAWGAASLIALRTLSQLGAVATVPATFAMVFRCFPRRERVRASALTSATLAGAAVIGVGVGGPLVDAFGWRPIFLIQAGIALLATLPALVVLPLDLARDTHSIDYAGAAVLAVTTFAITFGVNRLGVSGPRPWVLAILLLGPAALGVLVRVERRATSPILPLELLRLRQVRAVAAGSFLLGAGWMGSFLLTPLLLQSVIGLSAGATTLVSVPELDSSPCPLRWQVALACVSGSGSWCGGHPSGWPCPSSCSQRARVLSQPSWRRLHSLPAAGPSGTCNQVSSPQSVTPLRIGTSAQPRHCSRPPTRSGRWSGWDFSPPWPPTPPVPDRSSWPTC